MLGQAETYDRTWTQDFCYWFWDMSWLREHGYDDYGSLHLFPVYYAKHGKRRAYLHLNDSSGRRVARFGYVNAITLKFVPETSWSLHLSSIGFEKWLEPRRQGLVNVARYGIEGCLLHHHSSPPVADLEQELRARAKIERLCHEGSTSYYIELSWEVMADTRTVSYLLGRLTDRLTAAGFHVSLGLEASGCTMQALAESPDFSTEADVRSVLLS